MVTNITVAFIGWFQRSEVHRLDTNIHKSVHERHLLRFCQFQITCTNGWNVWKPKLFSDAQLCGEKKKSRSSWTWVILVTCFIKNWVLKCVWKRVHCWIPPFCLLLQYTRWKGFAFNAAFLHSLSLHCELVLFTQDQLEKSQGRSCWIPGSVTHSEMYWPFCF